MQAYFLCKYSIYVFVVFIEVPQSPTALRASDVTRNSLTLSWEPPIGDDTITGYIVEKKKEHTDEWVRVARTPGKVRTHNVTGLPVGGTFNFRVSAENPAGVSKPAQLPVAVELKGNKGNRTFQTTFFSVHFTSDA